MKNFFYTLFICAACLSCVREYPAGGDTEEYMIGFNLGTSFPEAKSALGGAGVESRINNVAAALYRADDGCLEDCCFGDAESVAVRVRAGVKYDICFLANVAGEESFAFPAQESSLGEMVYAIPDFESLKRNGIPCAAIVKGRTFDAPGNIPVTLERLMAKVRLRVLHDNLTAGDEELFSNLKVYVRQANRRLRPFSEGGSRAESEADIMDTGDYEKDLLGSRSGDVFEFYVPENAQGTDVKGRETLLTYMDYTGVLPEGADASGLEGEVRYRFFLGSQPGKEYSVLRNRNYDISLSFNPGNVLSPSWSIEPSLEDRGEIRIEAGNGELLSDGDVLTIRPGFPRKLKVKVLLDGKDLQKGGMLDPGEPVPDLARPYWTSDIGSVLDRRVKLTCDRTSGEFDLSVPDDASFETSEQEVEFRLLPEGRRKVRIKLRTRGRIGYDFNSSDFYVGEKRTLTLEGNSGDYVAEFSNGNALSRSGRFSESLDIYAVGSSSAESSKTCTLHLEPLDKLNDTPIDLNFPVRLPVLKIAATVANLVRLNAFLDGTPVEYNLMFFKEDGRTPVNPASFDDWCFENYLKPEFECSSACVDGDNAFPKGKLWLKDIPSTMDDILLNIVPKCGQSGAAPSIVLKLQDPFPDNGSTIGKVHLKWAQGIGKGKDIDTEFPISLNAGSENVSLDWETLQGGTFRPELGISGNSVSLKCPLSMQKAFRLTDLGTQKIKVTVRNKYSGKEKSAGYFLEFHYHLGIGFALGCARDKDIILETYPAGEQWLMPMGYDEFLMSDSIGLETPADGKLVGSNVAMRFYMTMGGKEIKETMKLSDMAPANFYYNFGEGSQTSAPWSWHMCTNLFTNGGNTFKINYLFDETEAGYELVGYIHLHRMNTSGGWIGAFCPDAGFVYPGSWKTFTMHEWKLK